MSLSNYFQNSEKRIRRYIEDYSDKEILRIIDDGKFDEFLQRHLLPLIEKDDNRIIELDRGKTIQGNTPLKVLYPVISKEKLDFVVKSHASSRNLYPSFKYQLQGGYIVLFTEFRGKDFLDKEIAKLEKEISWKNADIKKGNERIRQSADLLFQNEYNRIKSEYEEFQKLINQSNVPYGIVKKDPSSGTINEKNDDKVFPNSKPTRLKQVTDKKYKYDFFISHASEDKESFVRSLAKNSKKRATMFGMMNLL